MTTPQDKWLASIALMIAKIKSGQLSPLQADAMSRMTNDWQVQAVFTHDGPATLHLLDAAGLIESRACTIHYKYGYSPSIPMKLCPPEGTDEPGIEWRKVQQ